MYQIYQKCFIDNITDDLFKIYLDKFNYKSLKNHHDKRDGKYNFNYMDQKKKKDKLYFCFQFA